VKLIREPGMPDGIFIYNAIHTYCTMTEECLKEFYVTANIPLKGYVVVEKVAGKSGNSAYLYLPAKWAGKKVVAVLVENPEMPEG